MYVHVQKVNCWVKGRMLEHLVKRFACLEVSALGVFVRIVEYFFAYYCGE